LLTATYAKQGLRSVTPKGGSMHPVTSASTEHTSGTHGVQITCATTVRWVSSMKNPNAHWTDPVHLSKRFAEELARQRPQDLTNKEAYVIRFSTLTARGIVYWHNFYHKTIGLTQEVTTDYWFQVNTRNQLCKMEHLGMLERTSPGHYRWLGGGWFNEDQKLV